MSWRCMNNSSGYTCSHSYTAIVTSSLLLKCYVQTGKVSWIRWCARYSNSYHVLSPLLKMQFTVEHCRTVQYSLIQISSLFILDCWGKEQSLEQICISSMHCWPLFLMFCNYPIVYSKTCIQIYNFLVLPTLFCNNCFPKSTKNGNDTKVSSRDLQDDFSNQQSTDAILISSTLYRIAETVHIYFA